MTSLLRVTNGTISIDMIAEGSGVNLHDWNPKIAEPKQDGFWSENFYADGRVPVMKVYQNITDTFEITLLGSCQDGVIDKFNDLQQLLEDAWDYWTNNKNVTPVWVEARGLFETQTRYAFIYAYKFGSVTNPFEQPVEMINNLTLTIEHSLWRANAPANNACLALSSIGERPTNVSFEKFVASSGDDVHTVAPATISAVATDLLIGKSGANSAATGLRFNGVTIPPGATILGARLQLFASQADASATINCLIYGDDEDNAPVFSTYADFWARPRTTASVAWAAIASWVQGTLYYTPELTTIIQEIVDRANWLSGGNMAIFIQDNASTAAAQRRIASFDNATYTEPKLVVEYTIDGETETLTLSQHSCTQFEMGLQAYENNSVLTHIFTYSSATGLFSANQVDNAALSLFPGLAVNDYVYFGIAAASGSPAPITNLFIPIGTAGTQAAGGMTFQIYNGAWTSITSSANFYPQASPVLSPLYNGGVDFTFIVKISSLTGVVATTINGVSGYWVRLRRDTAVLLTSPVTDGKIYTKTWAHINIDAASVEGTAKALMNMHLVPMGDPTDLMRTLVALHPTYSGDTFSPFLAPSNVHCPPGVTTTILGGGTTALVTNIETGCQYVQNFAGGPGGRPVTGDEMFQWNLTSVYSGRFRVLLYMYQDGGAAGDICILGRYGYGNTFKDAKAVYTPQADTNIVIDLGVIEFTPAEAQWSGLAIRILGACAPAVNIDVVIRELVVLPLDTLAFEINGIHSNGNSGEAVDMISSTGKLCPYGALVSDGVTPKLQYGLLTVKATGVPLLKQRTAMKLYALPLKYNTVSGYTFDPYTAQEIGKMDFVQQYVLERGSK